MSNPLEPGRSVVPPAREFRSQPDPWYYLTAPGWTGDILRSLPDSTWRLFEQKWLTSPVGNPWGVLRLLVVGDPTTERFVRAGESHWLAYRHIAHRLRGGATESSDHVEAFKRGDRSDWVTNRFLDSLMGSTQGRSILLDDEGESLEIREMRDRAILEWEKRKSHQSKAAAAPKPVEYKELPQPLSEIVTYWLTGSLGIPGFAWCSDQAAATILRGLSPKSRPSGEDALSFKRTYQRAGLRKIKPRVYWAEFSGGLLLLLGRNRREIERVRIPTD